MSEFHVRVIRVGEIVPHDNADRLEIVMVDGGYPVVVAKGEFKVGDDAVYLPIDSIVPDTEDYAFLIPQETVQPTPLTSGAVPAVYLTQPKYQVGDVPEKYRRIKAKKIRGVFSMGMLRPLPAGAKYLLVGDNVQELMGIEKWDPDAAIEGPGSQFGGSTAKRSAYARLPWYRKPLSKIFWLRLKWDLKKKLGLVPVGFSASIEGPSSFPEYTDIESLRKHGNWLQDGEPVVITEKVHGANFRCGWVDDKFWVGSHHQFKAVPLPGQKTDIFWQVARDFELEGRTSELPEGVVLFGEIYGAVQKGFDYDASGKLKVRFFDALDTKARRYLNFSDFVTLCERIGVERVPVLYTGPWSKDLRSLADGNSTMAKHIREGFVVKPLEDRVKPHGGRVVLKMVGEKYLLQAAR